MSKVLTIERSKWARGQAPDTALLNDRGLMCCLGFDALACGLPERLIRHEGEPMCLDTRILDELHGDYLHSPRFVDSGDGDYVQSGLIDDAIRHNDDPNLCDDAREALIREDLKALGWDDVLFVD